MVARLILLSVLAGAASAQEPGAKPLTHGELKELLSKTRIVQFAFGRAKGTLVLAQDGKASVDGGSWQAKGTWRIDGDKYCSRYPGIRRGYETCYSVQSTGANTYKLLSTDGDVSTWLVEK